MPPKAAVLTKSQEDTPPSSPGRRPSAAACPPRRTKRRSSNFKVRAPRAGSARRRGASPTPSTSTRSLRHLRQEFRTGRSQGKLARTPDVTGGNAGSHQVTGGLIEEESLRPGRRHAPQGRGTHKAIRRHTKSFHISIPTFLGEEGSSLLLYSLFPNTFRGGLDFQSLSFITHSHKKTRLQECL
jgi:hypothetical protein